MGISSGHMGQINGESSRCQWLSRDFSELPDYSLGELSITHNFKLCLVRLQKELDTCALIC